MILMKTALISMLTLLTPTRFSRPKKAKDELNLEARLTALKNYIEYDKSSQDSKFQFVCDELKTINTPEYETITRLEKRIDFL